MLIGWRIVKRIPFFLESVALPLSIIAPGSRTRPAGRESSARTFSQVDEKKLEFPFCD